MLKIDPTKANKAWNSLIDKGPVVITMGIVIFFLFGWVQQGRVDDKKERDTEHREFMEFKRKTEAKQEYTQRQVLESLNRSNRALEQSNRTIERNNMILEEIARKID